jgi:hypothetical protein
VTRSISLPIHAALELALGVALLAGPFVLGLEPAGLVAAFSLGVLVVGLALAGPDSLPSPPTKPSISRSSPPSAAAGSGSRSPAIRRPGCCWPASARSSSRSSR